MKTYTIPGAVYSYIHEHYPEGEIHLSEIRRRGRGSTAYVEMADSTAQWLQERLEQDFDTLYVTAGTSEQLRAAYAVSRYSERLAQELRAKR